MTGNVQFLMKDVVLLAVSFYLLKQDVRRVVLTTAVNGQAELQAVPHSAQTVEDHPCKARSSASARWLRRCQSGRSSESVDGVGVGPAGS